MGFLADKKILITGMLSNRSIAYGVARACQREGATLAFTYVNDELKDRVVKIAAEFGSGAGPSVRRRRRDDDIDALFAALQVRVGRARRPAALDRVRAARGAGRRFPRRHVARRVRHRARHELELQLRGARQGRAAADAGAPRRRSLTLTYLGAVRALPNYNVMGLAKASLEANVRYLAACLGPEGIRVNGISAGPIKTLAAAGIGGFSKILQLRREGRRRCAATSRSTRSATSPRSASPIWRARSPARSPTSTAASRPSPSAMTTSERAAQARSTRRAGRDCRDRHRAPLRRRHRRRRPQRPRLRRLSRARRACRSACSSGAPCSAAPRSPRNSIRAFAIRPRATRSACSIRR